MESYITQLSKNLITLNVYDYGTVQKILDQLINSDIEKPDALTYKLMDMLILIYDNVYQLTQNSDAPPKIAYDKLTILILDALVFNAYSKIRNLEWSVINASLHLSSQSSMSNRSFESQGGTLERTKFRAFIKEFVNNDDIFQYLQAMIDLKGSEEEQIDLAQQVSYLVKTIDYILRKENIERDTFNNQKSKIAEALGSVPLKPPIKKEIAVINRIIFGGSFTKIQRLISAKKNTRQTHYSLIRLMSHYNKGPINKKNFVNCSVFGDDILHKIIMVYFESKMKEKETMFRENRNAEPLLDFILNYMTYNFLPVVASFDNLFKKQFLPYAKLSAVEFFQKFSEEGKAAVDEFLTKLPIDLKNFLRTLTLVLSNVDTGFTTLQIRALLVVRFLLGTEIRGQAFENKDDETQTFIEAANYFKDLFFESSQLKYTKVPNFKSIQSKLIQTLEQVMRGDRIPKNEANKLYLTKPLLLQDYVILRDAIADLRLTDYIDAKEIKIPYNFQSSFIRLKPVTVTQANNQKTDSLTKSSVTEQPKSSPVVDQPKPDNKNDSRNEKKKKLWEDSDEFEDSEDFQPIVENLLPKKEDKVPALALPNSKDQKMTKDELEIVSKAISTKPQIPTLKTGITQKSDSFDNANTNINANPNANTNSYTNPNPNANLQLNTNLQNSNNPKPNPNINASANANPQSKPNPQRNTNLSVNPAISSSSNVKTADEINAAPYAQTIKTIETFQLKPVDNEMDNAFQELEAEKSILKSKLDESLLQLRSQEDNYEREKFVMLSKINLLEEKNYFLGSSISRKNQEKFLEDDMSRSKSSLAQKKVDLNGSDFGSSRKQNPNKSVTIEDEYYILCSEIEKTYKVIQDYELKYVLHRRTHFPEEYS